MSKGDEILTTNHEYGANNLAWEWLLAKSGAKLVRQAIDTPVVSKERIFEQLFSGVTSQTRAIFLSHITSATALIMPIREICAEARKLGILTIVDGAHAPGQIPVDIQDLGADIYAGNLHKWMCAPKGAGFLYVAPEQQGWVESLIVSWGWGPDGELAQSTFVERNEWQGTRDLASFLSVPAAIEFQETHNWDRVRARCHALAASTRTAVSDLTGLEPISPDSTEWFGQMVSCPIETPNTEELKTRLYDDFRIEVPIGCWNDKPGMRVSYQGYNDENDLDRLMSGLHALL